MSLINNTLKNLEQQKKPIKKNEAEDNILSGLNASPTQKKYNYKSLLIITILLLILGLVLYSNFKPRHKNIVLHKINTVELKSLHPKAFVTAQPKSSSSRGPVPSPRGSFKSSSRGLIAGASNKHHPGKQLSSMKKTDIPLTPEQKLAEQYQNALALIMEKHTQAAFYKLHAILRGHPDDVDARITLSALLFKTGSQDDANSVLVSGLVRDPENIKLIEFQANMLANENKISQALIILQQHNPDIDEHPDYYALMALLYQRHGEFIFAADIYSQLVKKYPDNAVWWVGLGTSLESADKLKAAREAYSYALRIDGGLDADTRAYVEEKVKQLA